ncbi:unnamed protein product [Arctia plantaginis]|uniref:AN1-type domain-containing protein n=1 Tax=Arctia plantaginis TaxID=874455 RepID=A0A8S0ZQD9_ARCPL|nr:unnamed protein product [Arctia plantaginis]
MENDPSKKESKGKRIFKKAIRRNSKSNSGSQNSALEVGIGVSRSKSFENKHQSLEINDSTPLPKPDGTKEILESSAKSKVDDKAADHNQESAPTLESNGRKSVDIQENRNQLIGISPSASKKDAKQILSPPKLEIKDQRPSEADGVKKNLKRKFEEESGAGTSGASTGTSDTDADDKDPSKDKKKKNRCAVCRKKVGLTGFECRCGGLFCAVHRYSDKHDCSFDYRELGAQEIRRNNPVVVSQKIHKI